MKTTRFALQVCALLLTLFCVGTPPAESAAPRTAKIAFTWLKKGIYVVGRDGKEVKEVVSGARPAWSPDGEKLVYDAGGQLFTLDLKRRKSKQLTVRAVNVEGAWFDPGVLPIQPSAALLTTVWGRLKRR